MTKNEITSNPQGSYTVHIFILHPLKTMQTKNCLCVCIQTRPSVGICWHSLYSVKGRRKKKSFTCHLLSSTWVKILMNSVTLRAELVVEKDPYLKNMMIKINLHVHKPALNQRQSFLIKQVHISTKTSNISNSITTGEKKDSPL